VWSTVLPVNKTLWTGSYVLLATGGALMVFALLYALMDAAGRTLPARPLEVLGRNALLLFAGSSLVVRVLIALPPAGPSAYARLSGGFIGLGLSPANASLAFSCAYLGVWWLLLWALHRRRRFITLP
jgi:predicted acyltransferase